MNELEVAVNSISIGDYSKLTDIQEVIQDPARYQAFAGTLLDSLQSRDILIFHGFNLLVTAGTANPALYGTLKSRLQSLLDAGQSISCSGIAIGALSKLVALILSRCFTPEELSYFCAAISEADFTQNVFLASVVEDLLMQIASNCPAKYEDAAEKTILQLLLQVLAFLGNLMSSYITSSMSFSTQSENLQRLFLINIKTLVIGIKWEALSTKHTATGADAPSNSDDAFFLTKARPFPGLVSLLDTKFYTNATKVTLLAFLDGNDTLCSAMQEMFLALSTVTYDKASSRNIAYLISVTLLLRFYQFQTMGNNDTNNVDSEPVASLQRFILVLDLEQCLFQDVQPNIVMIANDFFACGAWIEPPADVMDEFFSIQVMQSLILGNGPTTLLAIFNCSTVTKQFCNFAFLLFFLYLSVSQDLEFAFYYLDSLMGIVHTSYQACIIGPPLALTSPDDARNLSLFSALNSFLVSLYTGSSEGLFNSQIQAYLAKSFDPIVSRTLIHNNLRRYSVRRCSKECAQTLRDFSINICTAVRYCCLCESMSVGRFDFRLQFQEDDLDKRIAADSLACEPDPSSLGYNLTRIIFSACLLFGVRTDMLTADDTNMNMTTSTCLSCTRSIVSQLCLLIQCSLHIVIHGFKGDYNWKIVTEACFYAQTALFWLRYTLYDDDDALAYAECFDQASQAILADSILGILQNIGFLQEKFSHSNLNDLFLSNTIICTLLLCFEVASDAKKSLVLPASAIMRAIERINIFCWETQSISTASFVTFLLEYRANVMELCGTLVGSIDALDIAQCVSYAHTLVVSEMGSTEPDGPLSKLLEGSTLTLSMASGWLSTLEKMDYEVSNSVKQGFLDQTFQAFGVLLPHLETLPGGHSSVITAMFLARDIFLFTECTMRRWLDCFGSGVVSFFKGLLDTAMALLCRTLQSIMSDIGLSKEQLTSLRHVYSGDDVSAVAFSTQEQLYITFLAASTICVDALNGLMSKMPSAFLCSSAEYRELLLYLHTSIMKILLDFAAILEHLDDDTITRIVDMLAMVLGQVNAVPDEEETVRLLRALCIFIDSLGSGHLSHKIRIMGCTTTFANASLLLHTGSDQVERLNSAYVEVIKGSISNLVCCALTQTQDREVISDLSAAIVPIVLVDTADTTTPLVQQRLDILRTQIVASVQMLGLPDIVGLVDSSFAEIHEMARAGKRGYVIPTPLRELLHTLQKICIQRL